MIYIITEHCSAVHIHLSYTFKHNFHCKISPTRARRTRGWTLLRAFSAARREKTVTRRPRPWRRLSWVKWNWAVTMCESRWPRRLTRIWTNPAAQTSPQHVPTSTTSVWWSTRGPGPSEMDPYQGGVAWWVVRTGNLVKSDQNPQTADRRIRCCVHPRAWTWTRQR